MLCVQVLRSEWVRLAASQGVAHRHRLFGRLVAALHRHRPDGADAPRKLHPVSTVLDLFTLDTPQSKTGSLLADSGPGRSLKVRCSHWGLGNATSSCLFFPESPSRPWLGPNRVHIACQEQGALPRKQLLQLDYFNLPYQQKALR